MIPLCVIDCYLAPPADKRRIIHPYYVQCPEQREVGPTRHNIDLPIVSLTTPMPTI